MITCKYCGSELNFIGEYKDKIYFGCDYCDLTFEKEETCNNRQRKQAVPNYYLQGYYKSTKELLKYNTINLFHLLRDCRKDWYDVFSLLKKVINIKENEVPDQKNIDNAFLPLYNEYVTLTKQKFIIENILLEKAGFIPEKITEKFLSEIIEQGRVASKKSMYIYIKKK